MNFPKNDEIVTIKAFCNCYEDSYVLLGYEYADNGSPQTFIDENLQPLIPERIHVEYKFEITRPVLKELEVVG